MKRSLQTIALTTCIILATACSNHPAKRVLTIATAANMQFAMAEIAHRFTEQTGIQCDLVISSSGKLTAQIKAGAPYDVFVAADMKYPEAIYNSGLAEAAPKNYARGKLVLWTMHDNITPSIDSLTADDINHIALANPTTAPYGAAATEVLQHHNLYDTLKNKLVFGESIAQTNQFITSGAAEIGFTAMSVVLSPQMKGKGKWTEIDAATYSPIEQGIVVIKHSNIKNKAAAAFYTFIFSDDAKKILTNFGYSVP